MTVKELIEQLTHCDPDFPVLIDGDCIIHDIQNVMDITHPNESHVVIWLGSWGGWNKEE